MPADPTANTESNERPVRPKPVWIQLTPEQEELLAAHFEWVLREARKDRRGILAAQVRGPTEIGSEGRARMRVGFISADVAETIAGAAT